MKKIINALAQEAADAATAGYDNVEWSFTPEGEMVDGAVENGFIGEAYFDKSDPDNLGWSYRITPIVNGERQNTRQESGSLS